MNCPYLTILYLFDQYRVGNRKAEIRKGGFQTRPYCFFGRRQRLKFKRDSNDEVDRTKF